LKQVLALLGRPLVAPQLSIERSIASFLKQGLI